LNEFYGWRMTFVLIGLPGLLLAVLAALTLREPRQAIQDPGAESRSAQPSLVEVWTTLWSDATFRHLLFCFSIVNFFGYGILQWLPTFLIRSYQLKTGELGTWFAVIYAIAGFGTLWGGVLASRYAANDERLQLKAMAILYSLIGVVSSFIYLSPNYVIALGWLGVAAIGGAMTSGPLFATIQTLVPERMRATSIAIIYLFANLIGMGLGPLVAGALSDALRPSFGEESLRYALLALCPGYFWGAWHLWQASKTVTRDLEATRVHDAGGEDVDFAMRSSVNTSIG
jgi:MFS transporter, Spinster family, sphingosine-1-phosphate transporter